MAVSNIYGQLQAWLLILMACFSTLQASADYYRAAVLEHVQFDDMSKSATEIVEKNLKIYEIAVREAALHGADIIVFPECGLFPPLNLNQSSLFEISEDVPNPKMKFSNPCNQTEYENRPILFKLSCLAKQHGIFVVANTFDKKNCEFTQFCDAEDLEACRSSTSDCPDNGHFFYNTNIVFDRDGVLIARYYKTHLYFEDLIKTPDAPEHVYFETDFGNFTTVICFDLIFKESVDAVSKPEVTNLAYPTYWFDNLPFIFFAVSYQQAWAMSNRINLLAANVHNPRKGTMGSGIYSAGRGALIYTDSPDGKSRILISNVPKVIDDTTNEIPLNAKRLVIESDIVVEDVEEGKFKTECSTNVLGPVSDVLTDYRCFHSPNDQFEYYKLHGLKGELEVCSNSFCCSLSYHALSMDDEEEYFLGITGTNLNVKIYSYGTEICFLARCDTLDGISCENYKLESQTIFSEVELKGNFSTQYVYPFVVNSGVRLADVKNWNFDEKGRISYINQNKDSSLIFLGLFGRKYDEDSILSV